MTDEVYQADAMITEDIDAYLSEHQNKSLLRFITCGSVDDGKSTLIGRLLYDSKTIFEDHLLQLRKDSEKSDSKETKIDFALLVDGLAAEREQGITIDVAYRFFSTEKRKFIVADTPGHEQYTRNMVTGASTAELAVILIDARKGILTQTRRHTYLAHLLGIKNIILAVNKMDLVTYSESTFNRIVSDYKLFADSIGIRDFFSLPLSATEGDNITFLSVKTPWYQGPSFLQYLETIDLDEVPCKALPFSMPVQWVNRPNLDFRGYAGKIFSGCIQKNDQVRILPSGKMSHVDRIVTFDGDLEKAVAGQSVTVTLKDELDCSRGQILTSANAPLEVADQFEAYIIWMDEKNLVPGRTYYLKIGAQTVSCTISQPKYKININTLERLAATTLDLNAIGVANVTLDRSIPFASYNESRALGGFILIDKSENSTVGAGLINFGLRRAQNIHWQATDITREHHAYLKNQSPALLWMTGLSGSGKSTIANAVERKLAHMNRHTFLLDGDNVRHGLCKDLGFTEKDRIENIRRVGELARLMTDAGLIVIAAFISPFRSEREMVRKMTAPGEFIEIFIDTPLEVAAERDVKGLYAMARSGELKNFTGIDSPYEIPQNPELHIDTGTISAEEAADLIIDILMSLQSPSSVKH